MPALRAMRVPFVVLAFAAWLRVLFNDVTSFSRADETQYLLVTQRLVERGFFGGYADVARDYLAAPASWIFPTPLRCGYFAMTTAACHLAGGCDYATLAWLSTVAGVVAVGFAWAIGRELLAERDALVGAVLVAVSPLQLAMSRRALSDEVTCAVSLAAVWAFVKLLHADRRRELRWAIVACVLAAFAMAVKETYVLYVPGLLALWLARRRERGFRRVDLLLLAAPALFWAAYSLLARSPRAFVEMAGVALGGAGQAYSQENYGGAAHRYLVDLLALSPPTTLLAIGAGAVLLAAPLRDDDRGAARLACLVGASLLAFSLVWKVLRFAVGIDALACLLAGWMLARLAARTARSGAWLAAGVVLVAAIDLQIFHRVFVVGGVYDPTTEAVLRALGVIAR